MACNIEFIPDAAKDFNALDRSLQKEAGKKIEALSDNPYLGIPFGKRLGVDLDGFYKLYFHKKRYRIVYRLIGDDIEVIEIVGIGKRDKEKIYRLVANRVKASFRSREK